MIKLAYVPPPPKGATVYAMLAATARLSPRPRLLSRLLGPHAVYARPIWPRGLRALAEAMPRPLGMTPRRLLLQHTLVPAFLPFMTSSRRAALIGASLELNAGEPALVAGAATTGLELPGFVRACPDCLHAGFHWCQCSHQMPGVLVCPGHPNIILHDTPITRSLREARTQFVDLRDVELGEPATCVVSRHAQERAASIAAAVQTLLTRALPRPGPEKFRNWMRAQLRAIGFAAPFGKVDLQRTVSAFRDWIGTEFSSAAGIPVPQRANDGNWLVGLLTTRRTAIHPIFAVLCALFVDVPIADAVAEADRFTPPVRPRTTPMPRGISPAHARFESNRVRLKILWSDPTLSVCAIGRQLKVRDVTVRRWAVRLALSFPRKGPSRTVVAPSARPMLPSFRDRVAEHRRLWRAAILRVPRNTGFARHPKTRALYAWLVRYDPAWFHLHRRVCGRRSRVDWPQRDTEIAARIAPTAAQLMQRKKPTRASRTRIAAVIGFDLCAKHFSRMPKTRSAFTRHAEPHSEFVARRLRALFEAGSISRRAIATALRKQPLLRYHPLTKQIFSNL